MRAAVGVGLVAAVLVATACTRKVEVGTDLGPLEQDAAIKGRDGGYSVRWGDRSLWVYGDSILSLEGEDGSSWRNNTWSWTLDLDATDGITGFTQPVDALGAPLELFPQTEAEASFNEAHAGDPCAESPCGARYALWPMDLVWDAQRDRLLLFYDRIYGEPGAWNFWTTGYGLAVWSDFDAGPERPVVDPSAEDPTAFWQADEGNWGDTALVVDDLLYAFACSQDGWSKPCAVARVVLEDALTRDAWRYWDGETWQSDPGEAADLFDGESQLTIRWNAALGRYLALYARWGDNALYGRVAPAPEGPWSDEVRLHEGLAPATDDFGIYCGLAHVEYAREDGRIQVASYYRSTGDWIGEIRLVELDLRGVW